MMSLDQRSVKLVIAPIAHERARCQYPLTKSNEDG